MPVTRATRSPSAVFPKRAGFLALQARLPDSDPVSLAIRSEAVAHPGEGARILSLHASAVYARPSEFEQTYQALVDHILLDFYKLDLEVLAGSQFQRDMWQETGDPVWLRALGVDKAHAGFPHSSGVDKLQASRPDSAMFASVVTVKLSGFAVQPGQLGGASHCQGIQMSPGLGYWPLHKRLN